MSGGPEWTEVEEPFLDQLVSMGWKLVLGSVDHPSVTGRESFREVLLEPDLREAVERINLRDGQPWLDEGRLSQAVSALDRIGAPKLMEANQEATELLLKGVQVEGLPDWDGGRARTVHFIDWDQPDNNTFLAISQFKVDCPGGQAKGSIRPDITLFINGIPVVVVECKSPNMSEPIAAAVDQLRRYHNARTAAGEVEEPEGNEQLFHTNQFLIATSYDEAKVGTIGADARFYLEWKDTAPVPLEHVQAELNKTHLSSQNKLIAGMLRPAHLLDIIRHFTLFNTVSGKTVKMVCRYQQYRAVAAAVDRLLNGRCWRAATAVARSSKSGPELPSFGPSEAIKRIAADAVPNEPFRSRLFESSCAHSHSNYLAAAFSPPHHRGSRFDLRLRRLPQSASALRAVVAVHRVGDVHGAARTHTIGADRRPLLTGSRAYWSSLDALRGRGRPAMTWSLQRVEHRVYPRNSLRAVVCQLQFDPILKVPERIADFQDRVRTDFPGFSTGDSVSLVLGANGPPQVNPIREFAFTNRNHATLTLSPSSLALESWNHRERSEFIRWFGNGLEALEAVYEDVHPLRLGLRYVNEVDLARVRADLGENVSLQDIIRPEFILTPSSVVDLHGTFFASEVTSTVRDGAMTVRSGVIPNAEGKHQFRLDVDRFVTENIDVVNVSAALEDFADDIFDVFHAAAGEALLRWMETTDA